MDSFNSLDSLKELPQSPGIYKMFSGDGKLIYVGKARDLKKRVSSYATGSGFHNLTLNKPTAKPGQIMSNCESLIRDYDP